jgi:hypothetical protein
MFHSFNLLRVLASYDQGEAVRQSMGDYSRTLLESQDQKTREIGKYCDAMTRSCCVVETKQAAYVFFCAFNFSSLCSFAKLETNSAWKSRHL